MVLPKQFEEKSYENIRIYHYIEELVGSYRDYVGNLLEDNEISLVEAPFLIRIRFSDKTTQDELTRLFNVSKGYTAKLLRKFEDKGWIIRFEDPTNHRRKIVQLTSDGISKSNELIEYMDNWESLITEGIGGDEVMLLKYLLFKMVHNTENF